MKNFLEKMISTLSEVKAPFSVWSGYIFFSPTLCVPSIQHLIT